MWQSIGSLGTSRQANRGSERIGLGGTVEDRLLRVEGLGSSLSVAGIALGDDLERGSIDVLDSQPQEVTK
jgi:hypothetical protein